MKEMEQRDYLTELALRAKQGDKAALDELLKASEIKGLICTIANEKVGPANSEDMYQDVRTIVWQKIKTWQGRSKITSWIRSITLNTCVDFLRSTKPQKLVFTNQLPEKQIGDEQCRYILEQEKYQVFMQAFQEIEKLCQDILNAFLFDGKTKKEIMTMKQVQQQKDFKKTAFYNKFNECCDHLQQNIEKKYQENPENNTLLSS